MSINTQAELDGIQQIGYIVGLALKEMIAFTKAGMNTREIDEYGNSILAHHGAVSAPLKDYKFPGYTCISINDEVCHGIPSENKIIKEGDLVNIDVSAELNGYYGDNGCSFVVGQDINHLSPLVDASREILNLAVKRIKHNTRINEIGDLIQKEARKRGFQVIKNLCGHGIGRKLHESPREIPNYKDHYNRGRFKKNMVIALETFISTKAQYAHQTDDNWTMKTNDGSFVAQHEHTLIVTENEPIILTAINGI